MNGVLMCAFIVLAFHVWRSWRREAKHDQVLFPLCQLRRDIVQFLRTNIRNNRCALSSEEGQSVLRLLEVLNDAIRNYKRHKTVMFNLREVAKYLRKHQDALKKARPLDVTDNPDIQAFYARFGLCSAKAFLAYTPLIRSELVLRVALYVSMYVWREGTRRAQRLMQDAARVRESNQRNSATAGAAA